MNLNKKPLILGILFFSLALVASTKLVQQNQDSRKQARLIFEDQPYSKPTPTPTPKVSCTKNEWYCSVTNKKKQCNSTGNGWLANQTCNSCSKSGKTVYCNCSVSSKVVATSQTGSPYGEIPMRADGQCSKIKIKNAGCGPVAVSEILQGKNSKYTPEFLMKDPGSPYYNSYNCNTGGGHLWAQAIASFKKYLGNDSASKSQYCDAADIRNWICQNKAVMLRFKSGSDTGHFLVAVATEGNQIVMKDPWGGVVKKYPSDYSGKNIYDCLPVKF